MPKINNTDLLRRKMDNLREKPCQCGKTMTQVIQVTKDGVQVPANRVGWYCSCGTFDKAIGREKKLG